MVCKDRHPFWFSMWLKYRHLGPPTAAQTSQSTGAFGTVSFVCTGKTDPCEIGHSFPLRTPFLYLAFPQPRIDSPLKGLLALSGLALFHLFK